MHLTAENPKRCLVGGQYRLASKSMKVLARVPSELRRNLVGEHIPNSDRKTPGLGICSSVQMGFK